MGDRFTIQRVQHVSVPRPPGSGDAARRFYGGILGLEEIPVPAGIAHLDLVWFRIGDDELHLFASDDGANNPGQHFCIQVDDLAALRDHLRSAGVATDDDIAIPNRPRFFCDDPFGNRIEVTEIRGSYLTPAADSDKAAL